MTTIKKIYNLRSCYPKASLKGGDHHPQAIPAYRCRKWKYVWKMEIQMGWQEGI